MRNIISPPWSVLREIGSLSIVRSTILIPIIGYLVLFNETIIQYLRLTPQLSADTDVGAVSYRLLLIYFGLVCFAIGSGLYSAFCPVEIKKYDTPSAFVAAERDVLGEFQLGLLEQRLRSKAPNVYTDLRSLIDRRPLAMNQVGEAAIKLANHTDIMQAYYLVRNRQAGEIRRLIALLFFVGAVLLLIPSAHVFVRCLDLLLRHITPA